jgi:UDP-N-acetylglucosamine 2-epimerase (non-hydrolysing)
MSDVWGNGGDDDLRAIVVVGTRPEGVKMAPVQHALSATPGIQSLLVSTGQHREMLQQVLDVFGLSPHRDLGVMIHNQSLAGLTARMVESIDGLLAEWEPDVVLVQGDTTTVFCAALCAFYRNISVGHVEAGLRTGNLRSPFPEEANRALAGRLATLHFAPTETARANLLREGVDPQSVLVTGNTVIDALVTEVQRQTEDGELRAGLDLELAKHLHNAGASSASKINDRPFVLVTGHRRESFGGGFERICDALACLARRFPDHRIIYPVHLNPNVRDVVHRRLRGLENLLLLPPLSYRLFVRLLSTCRVVLTDSGGVQEEAPSLGKPVLVMRENTERPEGIEAGTAKLVGTNPERIIAEVSRLLEDPVAYTAMAERQNPYGDGRASERIAEAIRTRIRPRRGP